MRLWCCDSSEETTGLLDREIPSSIGLSRTPFSPLPRGLKPVPYTVEIGAKDGRISAIPTFGEVGLLC